MARFLQYVQHRSWRGVSASSIHIARQRALAAGFDEHLTKPVDLRRLSRARPGQEVRIEAPA